MAAPLALIHLTFDIHLTRRIWTGSCAGECIDPLNCLHPGRQGNYGHSG